MYKHIALFTLLSVYCIVLPAQERGLLITQHYSPEDYNAPLQNWSVIKDSRGVLYVGNSNCILEYDGTEWRRIYMPNFSTVRNLAIDDKDILYAGAYNELGYLIPNELGELKYHSLIHLIASFFNLLIIFLWSSYFFIFIN